ncbi:hypothetical protein P7L75_09415 [Tistrella mobilis]|uniref:hypothetical protein n=1 Tax=Tistrella mobilis TaxID=171437 RepID=UPI003557EC20
MTWTPKPDTLPGMLSIVARIAGVDAALRLAEAHGGTRLYVPRDVRPGHELAGFWASRRPGWCAGRNWVATRTPCLPRRR